MANEQYVFIDKAKLPTREDWQKSIELLGFDLVLDPELDASVDEGFLPCMLNGKHTGVEIYYSETKELVDDLSEIEHITGGLNYCVSFRWGGSMAECVCAMIASSALQQDYAGIVSYEFEEPSDIESTLKDIKSYMGDAMKELEVAEALPATQVTNSEPQDGNVNIDKPKAWWKFW